VESRVCCRCVRRMVREQPVVLVVELAPLQNRRTPRLELYPFRFRDPLTGRWIRTRHKISRSAYRRCSSGACNNRGARDPTRTADEHGAI
jgi:hypothetical protein